MKPIDYRVSIMAAALALSFALMSAGNDIARAIRDTKIQVTVPQVKTTVQVKGGLPDPRDYMGVGR